MSVVDERKESGRPKPNMNLKQTTQDRGKYILENPCTICVTGFVDAV